MLPKIRRKHQLFALIIGFGVLYGGVVTKIKQIFGVMYYMEIRQQIKNRNNLPRDPRDPLYCYQYRFGYINK